MNEMRLNFRPADHKRLLLALRHEAFGLPDPCASAKAKGFHFSVEAAAVAVEFRDRKIARYGLGARNPTFCLWFSDAVPREAHEPIASVFSAMRETAERASKLLSADMRDLEALMEPMWGQRDQLGWFDVSRNDALRAFRAVGTLGLPLEAPIYSDQGNDHAFCVYPTARSSAFPENLISIHPLYVRDRSTVHDARVPGVELLSETVVQRILTDGLAAYHQAADFAPDGSRGQGITDKTRIVWSNIFFDHEAARKRNPLLRKTQPFLRTAEIEGFSVRLDQRVAQVMRNGVILLETNMSRNRDSRSFVDRELGQDRLGHLYRVMKEGADIALSRKPVPPAPIVQGPEDLLRAASEIDRGYAF